MPIFQNRWGRCYLYRASNRACGEHLETVKVASSLEGNFAKIVFLVGRKLQGGPKQRRGNVNYSNCVRK